MKKLIVVAAFVFILGFSAAAEAAFMSLPGSVGVQTQASTCNFNYLTGTVTDSGAGCMVMFPIPLQSGAFVNKVTAYYYDTSGSQGFAAGFQRRTLSTGAITTLSNATDYTTAATIQYMNLTGNTILATDAYWVYVYLTNGTRLDGLSIYIN